MTLETNRRHAEKSKSMCEVTNTILNNQGVKEEIKEEIFKNLTWKWKHKAHQNLWVLQKQFLEV